jgi:hypothetical protein
VIGLEIFSGGLAQRPTDLPLPVQKFNVWRQKSRQTLKVPHPALKDSAGLSRRGEGKFRR